MKKRLLAVAMAAVMTVGLAGCGEKESNGKTEITIGGLPTERTTQDAAWYDLTQKNIEEFQKLYSDCEIIPDSYTFNAKDFMTKAAGGDLPNILSIAPTELKNIVKNNYVLDITEFAKKYGYYDAFDSKYSKLYESDGKWYGIADSSSLYNMGIIYNIKLFEQAGLIDENGLPKYPQTWDELAQTAKTIKDKTGKAGFALATSSNYGGWHFLNILWDYGAEIMKKDNGKWVATFASKEGTAALQYIKDLKWKYDVLQDELITDVMGTGRMLSTNDAAMIMGQKSMVNIYHNSYEADVKNIAMSKLPAGPAGRYSQMSGNIYVFSKDSTPEQIDYCFKWLDFLGNGVNVTDEIKQKWEESYKVGQEKGSLVGVKSSSIWKSEERINAELDIQKKYATVESKFFDDYINGEGVEYRFEPEKCVQQLYSVLDSALQEVLTNKDADCAAVLEKAQYDFQHNYLDKETD